MYCYLCHTKELFFFRKNGYDLYQCPLCGLVQTDLGMPYKEFLPSFYDKGYFNGDESRGAYMDYQKDKPYIVRNMESILRVFPQTKGKKLLDIGSAYGYFVELALAYGYDAYGFDPCAYALTQVPSSIQKRLRHGTIHSLAYRKKSFTIVTMFDVIEHLEDPIADLKKIRTYIRDDGYLVIATGDIDSFLAKFLKNRWTFYIPPQHLFFFNKKTMQEVLYQAGFSIVRTFRIGKWVSLSYVLHLAKVSSHSHLAAYLIPIVRMLHLGNVPLYLPVMDNIVVIACPRVF